MVDHIKLASEFTKAYRDNQTSHVAIREARCLQAMYPSLCKEIQSEDLIAGRLWNDYLIGFTLTKHMSHHKELACIQSDSIPQNELTKEQRKFRENLLSSHGGFFFDYGAMKKLLEKPAIDSAKKQMIQDMIDFWFTENSAAKYLKMVPDEIKQSLSPVSAANMHYANSFYRLSCLSLNFEKLVQLGIPGLHQLIDEKLNQAKTQGNDTGLYEGMLLSLETLVNVCEHYRAQATEMIKAASDPLRKEQLSKMADTLEFIKHNKPQTLRQAAQLCWLFSLLADNLNYGRMDVYFGDLYCRDIDNGVETEESAKDIMREIWRLISELRSGGKPQIRSNGRIVLGGVGRRNPEQANRFALAALAVTKEMKVCEPQVTLRFARSQDPALMDKALDCIKNGSVNPTLYNDDVQVESVAKAFDVSMAEAEQYVPQGCGEIMIESRSIGSPNGIINYITALDYVLHNGFNTQLGEVRGLQSGELDEFQTFEELLTAFENQVDFTNGVFAKRHALEHKAQSENAAYLYFSMLTEDCIEKNKSILAGGTRYLGGQIETFGLTNVADSLYAIKRLVFDEQKMTLRDLVRILDANFEGYEEKRQQMLDLPKFGNDIPDVDDLHSRISNFVCQSASNKAKKEGLHFLLNVNLNPNGLVYSTNSKASADGRKYGEPFAVGNSPTAGLDRCGLTALLNSMAKADKLNGGYVHNLKVTKDMFRPSILPKFHSLLDGYFANGGSQIMITVVDPGELERAMEEPEKYQHVLVRVAGWTARFVDLSRRYQLEILNRTLY